MKIQCLAALVAATAFITSCASPPPEAPTMEQTTMEVQDYVQSEHVTDDRGRFREIFCEVLEQHGQSLPDYRPCNQALRITGKELGATGAPVPLGQSEGNYLILMVPGLGWNCFEDFLDIKYSGPRHVAQFGYEVRFVPVDGLSSSTNNAHMIKDFVAALPPEDAGRPLILMGYSKGTPDILEAVASYPEVAARTAAVISYAGAVHGSPLANDSSQAKANMLTVIPGSKCEEEDGDNAAVNSLRTDVRQKWLEENPLPQNIRYYSVVTFPEEDRVSWGLKNSWLLLAEQDIRNDTQVIIFDQMIPGSTVAAIVNADHWAIAVAVARNHPLIGKTVVNRNDYPREAFLEAMLRYVEEDLGQ